MTQPNHYLASYDPAAMTRALAVYYSVRTDDNPTPSDLATLVELGRKQLEQLQRILVTVAQAPPA